MSKEPNSTAVRTALWRAIHKRIDDAPYLIDDEIGLKLVAPDDSWTQRPDMHPDFTRRLRASMVARARFIEDQVIDVVDKGVTQYVLLGAGLDSFAQRHPELEGQLQIFEIDEEMTLNWKENKLQENGYGFAKNLHFVPVNFENSSSWFEELKKAGMDTSKPTIVTCTGVSLYLSREAIIATLKEMQQFVKGSKLVMTFYLPLELIEDIDKPLQEISIKGARESGNPFKSFFSPDALLSLAVNTGLTHSRIVDNKELVKLYFANRKDGLLPASGEYFLMADL